MKKIIKIKTPHFSYIFFVRSISYVFHTWSSKYWQFFCSLFFRPKFGVEFITLFNPHEADGALLVYAKYVVQKRNAFIPFGKFKKYENWKELFVKGQK